MSKSKLALFDDIATLFNKHGFKLFMVGGTSRDFLLEREILDFDFATDATPEEMKVFLPDANYRFSEFGTVSIKVDGIILEITTLRVEGDYIDYRHPASITFVKEPRLDYVRRDFTVNAIYIDEHYNILDFSTGLVDLHDNVIKMIGDPTTRFQEDPLRIIRALRFKVKLGFRFDPILEEAIYKNAYLVANLNPQKITAEKAKVMKKNRDLFEKLYIKYKL